MRKKRTSNALKGIASCMICAWSLCACGNVAEDSSDRKVMEESKAAEYEALFDEIEAITPYKSLSNTNPIMTQRFGADPYAMVYKDRVYFYMTGDTFEYDADGSVTENTYGKINTISVVSTTDMVNFEDHGTVYAAGSKGAAKWAANSWAPAAAWKEIDGEVKFFLYFANSGGGIGVLTSDSPTGPFEDPLGEALINNHTPNCADVIWIFDPAVLVDDDGRAYLYFGGGVPEGQAANPGTARVVELGEDMISIAGEPVIIDAPAAHIQRKSLPYRAGRPMRRTPRAARTPGRAERARSGVPSGAVKFCHFPKTCVTLPFPVFLPAPQLFCFSAAALSDRAL